MTVKRMIEFPAFMLVLFGMSSIASPVLADGKTQVAKEVAEYVMQRFGRKAVTEGTEVLARKIETAAARHGTEVFDAVRKVGPRALPVLEEAGAHGPQAARIMAQYGERGALVASRPRALRLVLQQGDAAAAVLVKHSGGIAEPLVEKFGAKAVKALESTGPQGGRRLAMMLEGGELEQIGRTNELLEVVREYGDPAMEWVWRNKGSLAVGTTLAAFLATPKTFLNAAQGITQTVAENALRPLAEVPASIANEGTAEVARGTNWTLVFLAGIFAYLAYRLVGRRHCRQGLFPLKQTPTLDPARPQPPAQTLPVAPAIINESTVNHV